MMLLLAAFAGLLFGFGVCLLARLERTVVSERTYESAQPDQECDPIGNEAIGRCLP